MPWIAEKLIYWGEDGDVSSTAYVRAFRVLRILKTDRFTGAADALGRVFYVNMHILGVAGVLAAMLVLFTSSLLYYSGDGAEGFESIPATMYLSILMLTGQGEPDGELTTLLKSLCAFTAIFSVAMVAIPASMLTFGFEIEAQRLVLKRRERRLRRRIRTERCINQNGAARLHAIDATPARFAHRRSGSRTTGSSPAATARMATRTFWRASGTSASAAVARTRLTCRRPRRSTRRSSLARRRRRRSSASAANSRPSRRSTTRCCGPWRTRRRPCSRVVAAMA